MDLILYTDFNRICRLCAKFSENMIPTMSDSIVEMIQVCLCLEVSMNNELPKQICQICLAELQRFYNFHGRCLDINKQLQKIITKGIKCEEVASSSEIKLENASIEQSEIKYSLVGDVKENINNFKQSGNIPKSDSEDELHLNKLLFKDKQEENTGDNIDNIQIFPCLASEQNSHNLKGKKLSFKFSCEACNSKFYQAKHLGNHMKEVHNAQGTKCEFCEVVTFHPLQSKSHRRSHKVIKRHQCNVCNKWFTSLSNLKRHQFSHTTNRPYHCLECSHSFKDKWSWRKHCSEHMATDDELRRSCPICSKIITKKHIKRHMETHETERKMFNCSICGKFTYTKEALSRHVLRVHEGAPKINVHLCSICGRRTESAARLRLHMRTHTGERPFACNICEKAFKSSWQLKMHTRIHTGDRPYICEICSKSFKTSWDLRSHGNVHQPGFRPHVCPLCSKSFQSSSKLKRHMLVHSGERKKTCSLCDKTFCTNFSMKKHEAKHHKIVI